MGNSSFFRYGLWVMGMGSVFVASYASAAPVVLQPPYRLKASDPNNGATNAVLLTWQDRSNGEIGYEVSRLIIPVSAKNPYQSIQTLGPGATSYLDSDLKHNVRYSYRVRAFKLSGSGSIAKRVYGGAGAALYKTGPAPDPILSFDPKLNCPGIEQLAVTQTSALPSSPDGSPGTYKYRIDGNLRVDGTIYTVIGDMTIYYEQSGAVLNSSMHMISVGSEDFEMAAFYKSGSQNMLAVFDGRPVPMTCNYELPDGSIISLTAAD